MAAGSVDDYDAARRELIAERFAAVADVDPSAVNVTVVAASVLVIAAIEVPYNAADDVGDALNATLSLPTNASGVIGKILVAPATFSREV